MDIELMQDLSALMDGEETTHSKDDLIEILVRCPEAQAYWQRLHVMRAALGNTLKTDEEALFERIQSEIAKSPAYRREKQT